MRRAIALAAATFTIALAAGLFPPRTAGGADVGVSITIGAPPQLVIVPGTPVYYAPALPYNYFHYAGQYYLFSNGAWYFAPTHNGPWAFIPVEYVPRPILAVPVRYYRAAPPHWKRKGPPPWAPAWGHRKKWKEKDDD